MRNNANGGGALAPDLHISMLGGFSVAVAGQPVDDHWRLRKAKTLVKLLALAPGHRLHREVVVEVLWPDADPAVAANNLHQLLHSVRRMIGPSSIALGDDVVRLGPAGGLTVDVDLFEQEALAARQGADVAALMHALLLWTGDLLPEDLYADWAAVHRERLAETHAAVAALLGSKLAAAGEHESALALLEPLASVRPRDEQLHRALIDTLAGSGRRWEAIDAFERLRDALDEAYGAEPEPQTTVLYQRLLRGGTTFEPRPSPPGVRDRTGPALETLVGRRQEWQRLQSAWQQACTGESRLFLISGEAGIGKTRLAEQLLIWAAGQGVATARTRSYSTDGRLALAPLTEWLRSDAIRPSLGRLDDVWLTEVARLMPELLSERPQLSHPEALADHGRSQHFHEALSRAVLTAPQPLLLLIDDVQWCDSGTLQWLQFLLRFDPTKRLLVMGTVRAEELMPGRPVTRWMLGLRSAGEVTELELEPLAAAETAQLAAQVVRRDLDDRSASQLFDETAGNPLYVVEMASAGLGRGARQRWGGGRDLGKALFAAADLPPRMHAVIAGRLAQLTPDALELAGLAAAVGRGFTAEIVRAASGLDLASLTEGLDELCHRRILRVAPQQAFDFSHDLIRDVAYAELSPTKRRHLHLSVAQAIKMLDAADLDPVSAELATQYERAGETVQAIPFYERAAEVAQHVYAHEESIRLIKHALGLLENVHDNAQREQQELRLLRLLSMALVGIHGYGAPEVLSTLSKWQSLNQHLDIPPDPPLLRALAIASLNACNFSQAEALGEQLLRLSDEQSDPILLVEAHYVQGVTVFWTGSFKASRRYLEQALARYDPTRSVEHISRYSQDPGVICQCRLAFDLWCLGYPDQAEVVQAEGLARARALAHPFSLAYALTWDAMLHGMTGDFEAVLRSTDAVASLAARHPLGLWSAWAKVLHGWGVAEMGAPELGIAALQRGDEEMHAVGAYFLKPFVSALLAKQFAKLGELDHGLALVAESLASADDEQSWYGAEVQRLRGRLLSRQSRHSADAEAACRRAIQIASSQHARAFELRAATSLSELAQ